MAWAEPLIAFGIAASATRRKIVIVTDEPDDPIEITSHVFVGTGLDTLAGTEIMARAIDQDQTPGELLIDGVVYPVRQATDDELAVIRKAVAQLWARQRRSRGR